MSESIFDLESANQEAKHRLVTALRGKGAHVSFDDAVHNFPVELMNTKPDHVPYTFWHQLEHMRITQADLLNYIQNPQYRSPSWPTGYWPDQTADADEAAWARTIAEYHVDTNELIALIEERQCDIFKPVAHMDNRSILRAVLLVIDHNAYHLGEFVMARQILGAWKSELA
jgi:hypothetical protein